MENWLRFDEPDQYKQWIEEQGVGRFAFKVGVFDEHRFGFDQSGYFFSRFIPDSPAILQTRNLLDTGTKKLKWTPSWN